MTRLPTTPAREQFSGEDLEIYDRVMARTSAMQGDDVDLSAGAAYFGALLNSPPLAAGITHMGMLVRTRGETPGTYTHAQRELVDVVLSTDYGYNGVLDIHIPDALAVGVRIEAIDAIRAGRLEALDDEERRLVDYVRAVVAGAVTDEAYSGIQQLIGERGALEYTIFILFLSFTIRMWMALDVPESSDAEIDAMLDDYRSGRRTPPDASARFR